MPFSRPTLTELRSQVAQHIAASLPGVDPLLRRSNLSILGDAVAGLSHLHYGYLDWVAQQATPFTCFGEYLEAWAALRSVYRTAAVRATGQVTFTGVDGVPLPAGTALSRGDGVPYTTLAAGVVVDGSVTVSAQADADPDGQAGAFGNCDAGTTFTLSGSIAGLGASGSAATAFTGGADIEDDESLKARMLLAFQTRAHGGSVADFVMWAREVPGVTRAWCLPHVFGAGTVGVYVMLDGVRSASNGLPSGTDGVAASESRGTLATGDQAAVADYIFTRQPVPARVVVLAPTQHVVGVTITGLSAASATTKEAVASAIAGVFRTYGVVSAKTTTILRSHIEAAVLSVPGTSGHILTVPAADVTVPAGSLPFLGTITWG